MTKAHLVSGAHHENGSESMSQLQDSNNERHLVFHGVSEVHRYPRGTGIGLDFQAHGITSDMKGNTMELGKANICREGKDAAVIAYGSSTNEALAAAEVLEQNGVSVTVVDARFCKPLDTDVVRLPSTHCTSNRIC